MRYVRPAQPSCRSVAAGGQALRRIDSAAKQMRASGKDRSFDHGVLGSIESEERTHDCENVRRDTAYPCAGPGHRDRFDCRPRTSGDNRISATTEYPRSVAPTASTASGSIASTAAFANSSTSSVTWMTALRVAIRLRRSVTN